MSENPLPEAFQRIPDPLSGGPALPPFRPGKPGRTRAELRRARTGLLVVTAAWFAAQLAFFGLRHELGIVPWSYLLVFTVGPLGAALLSFGAALSAGRLGLGASRGLLFSLTFAGPLAFIVLAFTLSPPYAGAALGTHQNSLICLSFGLLWALVPLLLAGIALKSSFVGAAGLRSAVLGAGSGLAAAFVSTLHCPLSGAMHVGFGHGGAAIIGALAGAFLLARLARA
jgi:hypothetical protein